MIGETIKTLEKIGIKSLLVENCHPFFLRKVSIYCNFTDCEKAEDI